MYYKKSDSYELFNCKGTILGMFEEYVVECDTLTLTSGDRLFFFTDGIVELADPDYTMLGYEGLIELLKKKQKLPIAELVSHVDDELVLYSKGKESDDDILMIAFEIK